MSNWTGRRVLVTGADGFIGSHVVDRLVAAGADVRAFVYYNSMGSRGWLDEASEEVRSAIEVVAGDVRDARMVENSMRGCDVVLHLAALIAIPYSYTAVESFVDTNIRGTLNILEAARACGVQRVVHTSTSEVYGSPQTVPITESHPLQGQSPYSASKIGADKLAESYYRSFELPVVILRPFNTYGPRQSARAVIPAMLTQMLAGKREIRLGSLEPRRDFTFVTDTAEGFLRAALADGVVGEVVQLGTGTDVSIGELFELAARTLGVDAVVEQDVQRVRPAKSEVDRLLSDPARAASLMGWQPTVTLEQGIRETADWLSRQLHRYRISEYSV